MKKTKSMKYFLLFTVFAIATHLTAQEDRTYLLGNILQTDRTPVDACQIQNLNKQIRIFSSPDGTFRLPVEANDTLMISFVGYKHQFVILPDSLKTEDLVKTFIIQKDAYLLSGVEIRAWPKTYEEFKEAMAEVRVPNPDSVYTINFNKNRTAPNADPTISIGGPFSMLYNMFSGEVKERKEYARLRAIEWQEDLILSKFNMALVEEVTQISDRRVLNAMLNYCPMQRNYLLKATEYEIYKHLIDCLELFREEQPEYFRKD